MKVITTRSNNYCLINIIGRLDSYTIPQLNISLQNVIPMGVRFIIIDLSKIDYISSSGLLTLVQTQKNFTVHNLGEIFLAGAPEVVLNSFAIAGFYKIFKFFVDIQSAIESIEIGK
ncbi:MAG: STAS domain-containing protein [Anaerolineaceae bacterium]|nr:STAS domain-containing protein [Anaerolineaceae bacterium]